MERVETSVSGASVFVAANPRDTVAASTPIEFDGDDIGGAVEAVNAGEFHGRARAPDCLRGLHEGISMRIHAANDDCDWCGLLRSRFQELSSDPNNKLSMEGDRARLAEIGLALQEQFSGVGTVQERDGGSELQPRPLLFRRRRCRRTHLSAGFHQFAD